MSLAGPSDRETYEQTLSPSPAAERDINAPSPVFSPASMCTCTYTGPTTFFDAEIELQHRLLPTSCPPTVHFNLEDTGHWNEQCLVHSLPSPWSVGCAPWWLQRICPRQPGGRLCPGEGQGSPGRTEDTNPPHHSCMALYNKERWTKIVEFHWVDWKWMH